MSDLIRLINMGPKTTQWLSEIGVYSEADLREMGIIEAYCQVKARHPRPVNLMFLYAMQGALMGVNCLHLPQEIKDSLIDDLKNHKSS